MRETPDSLPDRPSGLDSSLDVVGEVLGAVHLTTAVFGRLELGAPWRLRVPARGDLSLFVVARGRGGVGGGGGAGGGGGGAGSGDRARGAVALSAGGAVLLPQGSAHRLRDADRSDAPPLDFDYAACPHVWIGEGAHLGGGGPDRKSTR